MGTPILKFVFDRRKRASQWREGSVELRITYQRRSWYLTTGVRVLPRHWRSNQVVGRLDALEVQRTLDDFMLRARHVLNDMLCRGELEVPVLCRELTRRVDSEAAANVPLPEVKGSEFLEFCESRAKVRKYGRRRDSQERYDRFMRWFREWGEITDFGDITDEKVLEMDVALAARGMKNYSKWNNYHRFLNSFIIDAMDAGLVRRNPYRWVNIRKDKSAGGLGKYLSPDEFRQIASVELSLPSLERARDVFVFQTYTCLSYTDLAEFDASKLRVVRGRRVYTGFRRKTGQEFTIVLLPAAERVLAKYDGVLPVVSNAKYNDMLKVIALAAGINKPVSSHWARHTGATLLLNEGRVDMEVVAKVLGHSSTRITRQVYAKLLDDTVVEAIAGCERLLELR